MARDPYFELDQDCFRERLLKYTRKAFKLLPKLDKIRILDVGCAPKNTGRVTKLSKKNGVEVAGKIPFDPIVTDAMVNGMPVVEYAPRSEVAQEIEKVWKKILSVQK